MLDISRDLVAITDLAVLHKEIVQRTANGSSVGRIAVNTKCKLKKKYWAFYSL